jgi:hypothetical protein
VAVRDTGRRAATERCVPRNALLRAIACTAVVAGLVGCSRQSDATPSGEGILADAVDDFAQNSAIPAVTTAIAPTATNPIPRETSAPDPPASVSTSTSAAPPVITTTLPPVATTEPVTVSSTTPDPLASVFDRGCVVQAGPDGSLEQIAIALATITPRQLWIENRFVDGVAPGALVDVCVDNGVDDITGGVALSHADPQVAAQLHATVERQQVKLNELLTPFGTALLEIDGVSGPRTAQRLCAARLALNLAPTLNDMEPGSDEMRLLFNTTSLPAPAVMDPGTERWALIDQTCQMMLVGSGTGLVFVFPTSTGQAGFETRDQDRARAFRYNPAIDNGGWHNSSEYPVGVDNPLNGNMYKPLYFDLGQAIHGANNVPPTPQSKGCARLSVADHSAMLDWLGLLDRTEETWRTAEINFTVTVQGRFVPR